MFHTNKIFRTIITRPIAQSVRASSSASISIDEVKKITTELIENKDDVETLKYLIKYKYNKFILSNDSRTIKSVIYSNENMKKIYSDYLYGLYSKPN